MPPLAAHGAQLAAAVLGGLLFHLLGIPAAWLSGAMVGVVVWGAFGLARPTPRPLVDAAMLVSGATMGAGVTPEAIAAVGRYPSSLALLVLGIGAIVAASMLWLVRVSGWRRDDALLASVPGALSTVLAVAADRGADVASVAVVQAFRLFVLIAVLPSVVVALGGGSASALPGEGLPVAPPLEMAVVLAGGLALGLVFERLRVAAPILLGATLVSAALHGSDLAPGVVPPGVAAGGFVLIGLFVGERFRNLDASAMRATIPAALGSFLVGMAVAGLLALAATALVSVPLADALVAFAPGGLEAMVVLSLALGLDPLYVGTHHLVRFLGIGVVLPLMFAGRKRE